MSTELEQLASEHEDRIKVISVKYLGDLKRIINEFSQNEELNSFQDWIVNNLYNYEVPKAEFGIKSIILMAIHHPFYAKVNFYYDGRAFSALSLVPPDFIGAERYLKAFTDKRGWHIIPAGSLPLKRLGVHSGLAKYGRNNISYIEGLGSNFSYAAYFSDLPVENDTWGEVTNAEICSNCTACLNSCPTNAIQKDKFLIDNKRCLSFFNEVPNEMPDWLPLSAHHSLYDCIICQRVCPMNKNQVSNVYDNISFTEEETSMLLEGKAFEEFSEDMKRRIFFLGLNDWYSAIPRNLKLLLGKKYNAEGE